MWLSPLQSRWSWPKERSKQPWRAALRFAWTAPTNLLGHALGRCLSWRPPQYFEGPAARGWFYPMPKTFSPMGAVAIGHAILYHPDFFLGEDAAAIMAHELAHTRQHDILGPLYLPAHILCQLLSLALWPFAKQRCYSPVHDFNPLEQSWICLGVGHIRTLAEGSLMSPEERARYLACFGLTPDSSLSGR